MVNNSDNIGIELSNISNTENDNDSDESMSLIGDNSQIKTCNCINYKYPITSIFFDNIHKNITEKYSNDISCLIISSFYGYIAVSFICEIFIIYLLAKIGFIYNSILILLYVCIFGIIIIDICIIDHIVILLIHSYYYFVFFFKYSLKNCNLCLRETFTDDNADKSNHIESDIHFEYCYDNMRCNIGKNKYIIQRFNNIIIYHITKHCCKFGVFTTEWILMLCNMLNWIISLSFIILLIVYVIRAGYDDNRNLYYCMIILGCLSYNIVTYILIFAEYIFRSIYLWIKTCVNVFIDIIQIIYNSCIISCHSLSQSDHHELHHHLDTVVVEFP